MLAKRASVTPLATATASMDGLASAAAWTVSSFDDAWTHSGGH
jgi:hypothetical protein